ncbi:MAG: NAD-dependent epimerase/dehydratase family protein [Gammaproteobacteria bacterium]
MQKNEKKILITGHLGFIGFHLAKRLIYEGHTIMGIDSLNKYYSQKLKKDRGKVLDRISGNYISKIEDISNEEVTKTLKKFKPDIIVNLAAQAGVRHSLTNPEDYVSNNISSFLNIVKYAKDYGIEKIVYASTSSVYGGNTDFPFSENDRVDNPLQFYAVTKRTNELMASAFNDLYRINFIGLRFFTVYGPWGRPDMSIHKFTNLIINNKPIDVFNYGKHSRDFTYIDDVVEGISLVCLKKNKYLSQSYSEIYNIGGDNPITLNNLIKEIEKNLGKKAKKNLMPLQMGDVKKTVSNIRKIEKHYGFSPKTSIKEGIKSFIDWYKSYY